MTTLDRTIRRQFGWLDGLALPDLTADPALLRPVQTSSLDDPTYTRPAVDRRDVQVDGPLGPASSRVHVHTPSLGAAGPRAALVWAQGGGIFSGTLDDAESDLAARKVCASDDVIVVTVDYHLGADGSHPYPVLHREVAAALESTRATTLVSGTKKTHPDDHSTAEELR